MLLLAAGQKWQLFEHPIPEHFRHGRTVFQHKRVLHVARAQPDFSFRVGFAHVMIVLNWAPGVALPVVEHKFVDVRTDQVVLQILHLKRSEQVNTSVVISCVRLIWPLLGGAGRFSSE